LREVPALVVTFGEDSKAYEALSKLKELDDTSVAALRHGQIASRLRS
jgi:hypothetical protein